MYFVGCLLRIRFSDVVGYAVAGEGAAAFFVAAENADQVRGFDMFFDHELHITHIPNFFILTIMELDLRPKCSAISWTDRPSSHIDLSSSSASAVHTS